MEKSVGYMKICDDLMRERFDAKRVKWIGVGSLENGGVEDGGGVGVTIRDPTPDSIYRPQLP